MAFLVTTGGSFAATLGRTATAAPAAVKPINLRRVNFIAPMMPRLAPCYNRPVNAKERAELLAQVAAMTPEAREVLEIALELIQARPRKGLRRNKVSTKVEGRMETRTITPESLARKRSAISKAQTRHPKHPFVRAAQERFGSVSAWVSRHPRLKLSTVSSWYNTSSNPRPIPPEFARLIEEELDVPATETVWRNGIR